MASARISSSSSYSPFETNGNNVRDASFSSYLALVRQSFSTEFANPGSRRSSFQTTAAPPKRTSMDNSNELDVFAAEKYFCGRLGVQDYPELLTSEDLKSNWSSSSKNKKKSATRSRSSTCSETSANSHSILLGRSSRQQHQPATAASRRNFLDVFRCYCSKKNFVKDEADDNCSIRSSSKHLPSSGRSPSTAALQSESSSDLFEIESASMSSPPVVYEPSEASIDWSVATASAANLSVASSSALATEGFKVRGRSSGLLRFGCASEKAVCVTPDKVGAPERYHVLMDLAGSATTAGTVSAAARPRWTSLR